MTSLEFKESQAGSRPYGQLKEDPRFEQIRRMIEKLSPEQIRLLEKCLQRWGKKSFRSNGLV